MEWAMINVSRPSVHPVEAPPPRDQGGPNRVRMKDLQGTPGTLGGLALRLSQLLFAAFSFSLMLLSTHFLTLTAVFYLVMAVCLQCIWSLTLAAVDVYALLVRRSLRNHIILSIFTIGDGITSTMTFGAACASAGITIHTRSELNKCREYHCTTFEIATVMAFFSWFAISPSFLLNFWSLASQY